MAKFGQGFLGSENGKLGAKVPADNYERGTRNGSSQFLGRGCSCRRSSSIDWNDGCATNNDLPSTGDVDLKALAKEIDRLASIEEIRAQLFNYIQAVDRIDYELGYSVFAEDSLLDYGSYYYDIFPNMTGRQFIDSCLGDHLNGCKWTHHMYSAMRIDVNVDNGTAGSSTYGHINQIFSPDGKAQATAVKDANPNPGDVLAHQRVRYNDLWERRDGKWVIVKRTVSYDIPYNETIEAKAGVNAENAYRGDEYKKDPSYEAFAYGA